MAIEAIILESSITISTSEFVTEYPPAKGRINAGRRAPVREASANLVDCCVKQRSQRAHLERILVERYLSHPDASSQVVLTLPVATSESLGRTRSPQKRLSASRTGLVDQAPKMSLAA